VSVATFENDFCAIWDDGAVHCTGTNNNGKLAFGSLGSATTWSAEMTSANENLGRVAKVGIGNRHTCVMNDVGAMFCAGAPGDSRLGYYSGTDVYSLMRVDLPDDETLIDLDCGFDSTCVVDSSHRLRCLGSRSYGVFGDGYTYGSRSTLAVMMENVASVQSVYYSTYVTLLNGTILGAGENSRGHMGVPSSTPTTEFVALTWVENAKDVAFGRYHSCAINESDELYCVGSNTKGQLGDGGNVHMRHRARRQRLLLGVQREQRAQRRLS